MKLFLRLFSLLFLVATLGLPAARADATPRPTLSPEASRVARDFLFAFSRNDREAISRMLPKQANNRYGPSPFTRMPALLKPRIDGGMGVIEFRAPRAEGLSDRGIIVLRKREQWRNRTLRYVWRVRQIYWYDELPPDARLPEKSRTPADKQEEPRLVEATKDFLHSWMVADIEQLDKAVFHWWDIDQDAPKWVKMTSVELKQPTASLGGLRVDFTAKLRLLGALPRSVDGTLWLVQEDGAWRVRPLTVAVWF